MRFGSYAAAATFILFKRAQRELERWYVHRRRIERTEAATTTVHMVVSSERQVLCRRRGEVEVEICIGDQL